MQCVPICLDCKNWQKGDICKYYEEIPQHIKLREEKCPYYTGGEYEVIKAVYKGERNDNRQQQRISKRV